jgi:hypothetical protein
MIRSLMFRKRLLLVVAVAFCAASPKLLQAQGVRGSTRGQRYSPSRPTVSPYLNLLRRDNGPVPNYHTLVRPEFQQLANNQQQQVQINTQQGNLANLHDQLQIKEPGVRSTGTASVYGDRSHYYPAQTGGRAR